jgi:hypothetical protein
MNALEEIVRMKSLQLMGLMALAAATTLYGQPTNGAQYWSLSPPDCSTLNQSPTPIKNGSGTTIGYSCSVSGTFPWLAAGAGWGSAIRVAAPTSAPIGVDISFYDNEGNPQALDVSGSYPTSSDDVNFALFENQPVELDLLGSAGTDHSDLATGSVFAIFYCPDAVTCSNVLPQLIYSALPSIPWSLSVPLAFDQFLSATWSAVGEDNGLSGGPNSKIVSFVVYNEDSVAHSYTISVYNSAGGFVGQGVTPVLQPSTATLNGGTYAALLKDVIPQGLPAGPFKVVVDGGPNGILSAVVVLQFTGPSGTSLQVAYDSAPGSSTNAATVRRQSVRRQRAASTPRRMFSPLPK